MALEFEHVEGRSLTKLYGTTRALTGVDVRFEAGEVTAIEGPNGSGKSTLLSLLSLLARPTRGELRFGDHDPRRRGSLRASIGVLAHAALVYPDLTGQENLELAARLYGLTPNDAAPLSERFELGRFMERPARTYSRGQLQRLSLARALVHRPQLLLLDEPSTGLDASGVERLCTAIRAERERGAIVVLVTHDSALAETIADRRLRLKSGRVVEVADGAAA